MQHVSGRQREAQVHLATAAALVSSGHVRPWPYIAPSAVLAWTLNELDDLEAAASEATDALQRAGRAGNVALLPMSYMAIATAYQLRRPLGRRLGRDRRDERAVPRDRESLLAPRR